MEGPTRGVLELLGNIVRETEARKIVDLPGGLGMIVTRELVGVYEFVTAPFPLPAGFKPAI